MGEKANGWEGILFGIGSSIRALPLLPQRARRSGSYRAAPLCVHATAAPVTCLDVDVTQRSMERREGVATARNAAARAKVLCVRVHAATFLTRYNPRTHRLRGVGMR